MYIVLLRFLGVHFDNNSQELARPSMMIKVRVSKLCIIFTTIPNHTYSGRLKAYRHIILSEKATDTNIFIVSFMNCPYWQLYNCQ